MNILYTWNFVVVRILDGKEESELKQEQFAALALDSGIYFASKEWEILLNLFPQSGVNSDRKTV